MSYIFDALQKAQADRSKPGEQSSLAALELLERAEREAEAQYDSEAFEETPVETATEHQVPLFSGEGFGQAAIETDPIAITNALKEEQRRELFSQFQALEIQQSRHSRLVCLVDSDSPATEAFHLLGVRLRNLRKEREFKTLLVTSTVPKEGKSVVAANLACTLGSGAKEKVLLLEGDVRLPAQWEIFGLSQLPGLRNYLLGKRSLTASVYHLPKAGIWIMPAGDNRGDVRELLQSQQLPALMTTLSSLFDWIVIDSPPVLPLVDTSIWARLADEILIVARHGTTRKQKLQKGLEALDSKKIIGALLNSSNSSGDSYDYYHSYRTEAPKGQEAEVD